MGSARCGPDQGHHERFNVLSFLSVLSDVLDREGLMVEPGAAVAAAEGVYRRSAPEG